MSKAKRALVKGARLAGRAERKLKRQMRIALGMEKRPEPYVHPWLKQELGHPTIVDQLAKNHCCGCGSCNLACPVNAITMEEDDEGFAYPVVDHEKCIDCGRCVKKCPVLQDQPSNRVVNTCFATKANEDILKVSSSGGFFTQAAQYAFEKGGIVFGAGYTSPDCVMQQSAESMEELDKLRRSKYVQSATGDSYRQAEQCLKEGRFVLYTGCPCQVAGLYAYLGKDYDNLMTVDLICHGVPSPGLFRRYLKEDYPNDEIKEVNFRDKSAFGWSTHMNIYMEDGHVHRDVCSHDSWYRMFLPCLAQRPFCSNCKFTRLPRVADVSIGDWWGIDKFDAKLSDGKGVSLVLVNNEKGQKLFDELKPDMSACESFALSKAKPRNYTIDRPFRAHPERARFFELLKIYSFDKAVAYALDRKADVGIYGLWYGENYGSILTYYGLNCILHDLNLSTFMIANPLGSDESARREPTQFAVRNGYEITQRYTLGGLGSLNKNCDAFMLGSDQLWNPPLSRPYRHTYYLNFVANDRKRIAYATSAGHANVKLDPVYSNRCQYELEKFYAISVRDSFTGKMLEERYGVPSTQVLDPALLCDSSKYAELADHGSCAVVEKNGESFDFEYTSYIFAYLLDPNEKTIGALSRLAELRKQPIVVALNLNPKVWETNLETMRGWEESEYLYVMDRPITEAWLYALSRSEAVLTDSFHGSIFAYVFEKRFAAVVNKKRGPQRFYDVMDSVGLRDRLMKDYRDDVAAVSEMLDRPIDFEESHKLLEAEKEKSMAWLKNAVFGPFEQPTYKVYPFVEDPTDTE